MTITIPIRLVSVANVREHWGKRAGRTKAHRNAGRLFCRHLGFPLPVTVRITRIAPRPLDDDNLRSACKALRDGIADALGVDDRSPLVTWEYEQERGKPKEYAVRIVITPRPES